MTTKPKEPMNEIIKAFLNSKGTQSYRTILIVIVCYVGIKVSEVDRRLAEIDHRLTAIESRLTTAHIAAAAYYQPGGAEENTKETN